MEVQSEIYPKVAVIGGGSFGTAVVKMVSENTGLCHWWMHNEESAAHIREVPPQSTVPLFGGF